MPITSAVCSICSSAHSAAYSSATPAAKAAPAQLYAVLVDGHGSIGAHIGHAVALAESGQVAQGLAVLAALPEPQVRKHQPWWVARAHLLRMTADAGGADAAARRALGLTADERVRRFLRRSHGLVA